MYLLNAILLATVVITVKAANNYNYCGHIWKTENYYATAHSKTQILSSAMKTKGFARSDLVLKVDGEVTFSRGYRTGLFEKRKIQVSTSGFCTGSNDVLHSDDFNGDSQEDLLCYKANSGTFEVKYRTAFGFSATQKYGGTFTCSSANALSIGDFDGNKAADIACLNSGIGTSKIYLGQTCTKFFSPHPKVYHPLPNQPPYPLSHSSKPHPQMAYSDMAVHHHAYNPHARYARQIHPQTQYAYNPYGTYKTHCPPGFPKEIVVPSGTFAGCTPGTDKIIVADANGDNKDDVICHKTNNYIVFYLSTGTVTSVLFGGAINVAPSVSCDFNNGKIKATDVDGDGDKDLVCIGTAAQFGISYFSGGTYHDFTSDPTCPVPCTYSSPDAIFAVGDFNEDGKDDIVCKYSKAGGGDVSVTEFIYAEKIAV